MFRCYILGGTVHIFFDPRICNLPVSFKLAIYETMDEEKENSRIMLKTLMEKVSTCTPLVSLQISNSPGASGNIFASTF